MEGRAVWLRIVKAIEELLSEERPEGAIDLLRKSIFCRFRVFPTQFVAFFFNLSTSLWSFEPR